MVELSACKSDAVSSVCEISAVIRGAVQTVQPSEVIVIKVYNWFGPKWLGFSHKMMGLAGVTGWENFTIPPSKP